MEALETSTDFVLQCIRLGTEHWKKSATRVARMSSRDVVRLTQNPQIIRNRRKIEATIYNVRQFVEIAAQQGSYRRWLSALPVERPRDRKALLPIFRERFRFMGPETVTCYLMGVGKIPPAHDRRCWMSASR